MLELIGKEFSLETIRAQNFLKTKGLDFVFRDIDFDEEAMDWVKFHKIMALPILKKGDVFVVGERDLDKLID